MHLLGWLSHSQLNVPLRVEVIWSLRFQCWCTVFRRSRFVIIRSHVQRNRHARFYMKKIIYDFLAILYTSLKNTYWVLTLITFAAARCYKKRNSRAAYKALTMARIAGFNIDAKPPGVVVVKMSSWDTITPLAFLSQLTALTEKRRRLKCWCNDGLHSEVLWQSWSL